MVKCNSCKYSSKFTNGLILCDFLKTKICVTANHTCKYGKPEEKMKNLINGQPEQDIDHCGNCIHSADSLEICVLRECKYAIGELIDCYEPKQFEQSWIPCSERLPEHTGTYLVTDIVAVDKYVTTGWYSTKGSWICDGYVEAWMPLPEPYKEK